MPGCDAPGDPDAPTSRSQEACFVEVCWKDVWLSWRQSGALVNSCASDFTTSCHVPGDPDLPHMWLYLAAESRPQADKACLDLGA